MKTLYIYGDSNTYGYDPSDFWGDRYEEKDVWTSIVQSRLFGKWTVIADGLNGRDIPGTDFERTRLRSRVERHMPLSLFAVMLGTTVKIPGSITAPVQAEEIMILE